MSIEDSARFAAGYDSHARLWTPHRMAYIRGDAAPVSAEPEDCPFCLAPTRSDEDGLIVHRGESCYVVLNLFPYNPGHLLICPYRHVAGFTDMNRQERYEASDLTEAAIEVLRAVKAPLGFNLGMNIGSAAGAGVEAHAHQHVVPRWGGDSNFLPIIGQTKALPELLADTRQQLATAWEIHGSR